MATTSTVFKPTVIGGFVQRGRRARRKRPRRFKPELTIAQILAWADSHHERASGLMRWLDQSTNSRKRRGTESSRPSAEGGLLFP